MTSHLSIDSSDCFSYETIASNGLWGDSSLNDFALPVLLVYIMVTMATSQALAPLLRRVRQPRVIVEIITGILWGKTLAGQFLMTKVGPIHNKDPYLYDTFIGKPWAVNMHKVAGHLGLFIFIFLVGVDMDASLLKRTVKKSVVVAAAGIALPVAVTGAAFYLFKDSFYVDGLMPHRIEYFVLLGIQFTATSFPVVARILTELKLLSTEFGRIAMSAALINEVLAWTILPILMPGLDMVSTDTFLSQLPSWLKLGGWVSSMVLIVALCWLCVRPTVWWIQRQTPEGESISHGYLSMILAAALFSGFLSDGIGLHYLVGGFAFGLAIPSGPVATSIVEMLEEFVTNLLLPLYFTIGGISTDLTALFRPAAPSNGSAPTPMGPSAAFLITPLLAGAAKVGGTVAASLFLSIPLNEALSLGFIMNCKSLLEIMLLDLSIDNAVLQPASLAAMSLEFFVMTIVVTPALSVFLKQSKHRPLTGYKRRNLQRSKLDGELRMMTCVHNARNVPAILSLLEVSNPTKRSPIFVYALHLTELTGHASAMLIVHGSDGPGGKHGASEHIINAFENYEQHAGGVSVQTLTAIAAYPTMHEDICTAAGDRHAAIIILPFHKQLAVDGGMEEIHPDIRGLNQRVLDCAPCSVGILVDRGLSGTARYAGGKHHNVAVLYFGGPDDREALAYAWRMAEHPGITVTVVRFLPVGGLWGTSPAECEEEESRVIMMSSHERSEELRLDDEYLSEFRLRYVSDDSVMYAEKVVNNSEETVTAIRTLDGNYDLYVVGRGKGMEYSPLTKGLTEWSEHPELGPIGDLLASTDFGTAVSVLVVQQYVGADEEVPAVSNSRRQPVRQYLTHHNAKSAARPDDDFHSGWHGGV